MNGQQDNEREASMSEERNIKTPTNGTNGNGNGEGVAPHCFCQFFGLRISDPITLSVVYNWFFLRNLVRQQRTDLTSFCMQLEKKRMWVNAGGLSE